MRRALSLLSGSGQVVKLPNKGVLVPVDERQSGDEQSTPVTMVQKKIVIGVAWSAVPDYNLVKWEEGIVKYAAEHQLEVRNYTSALNHEGTLNFLNHIEDYGVDGAIVVPYHTPEYVAALSRLMERRFPLVSIRTVPGISLNVVSANRGVGAYNATHYLIEKYKQPVYYICEPIETETEQTQCLGYQSAMCEAGFDRLVDSHTLRYGLGTEDAGFWDNQKKWYPGYTVAKKLFERISEPVSILGLSDYVGQGVYEAAKEYHLTIGKDVRIVGFDDLPMTSFLNPTMSTVRTRKIDIGYEAMRLLQKVIAKYPEKTISVEVPCDLIIRESA
jgi:LacI family transcriptional regulator